MGTKTVVRKSLRKHLNNWLKEVKLEKGEGFSVITNETTFKVEVSDEKGEYKDDYDRA